MKTIFGFTLSFFCTLWITVAGAAPAGTAFTYQGRLVSGGNAANGVYDFAFALYNVASGPGQVADAVVFAGVGVTNGNFTVALDFGNVFDGSARWLGVSVKTNGTMTYTDLTPRQALTPTPYALFSSNAVSANFAQVANSLATNAVSGEAIQAGTVVKGLNGLHDEVTMVAGTNVTLLTNGNEMLIAAGPWEPSEYGTWISRKVGIGRPPVNSAVLQVAQPDSGLGGNIHVGAYAYGGDPKLIEFGDLMASGVAYVYIGENGADDRMELRAGSFYFTNGNVGIRKLASVYNALDVEGNVAANSFSGSGWNLTNLNAGNLSGSVPDDHLSASVAMLNKSQQFTANNTFLQPVGVGTPATTYEMLAVGGDVRINKHELFLLDNNDPFHGLGWYGYGKTFSGADVNGPVLYGFGGGGLGWTGGSTNLALQWDGHGNVAVDPQSLNGGSLVPGLTFGLNSGEGISSSRASGAMNRFGLDFYTKSTRRMSIDQNGNVGIGTATPGSALDVAGTIMADRLLVGETSSVTGSYGSIGGGVRNTNQSDVATLAGGSNNVIQANSVGSTIGGGIMHTIYPSNIASTIAGGFHHTIMPGSSAATIGGGESHSIYTNAYGATIAGGIQNIIQTNGFYGTVAGGTYNRVLAPSAFIGGGGYDGNNMRGNVASGISSVVVGGVGNTAGGPYSTVGGGSANTATNWYANIPGGAWNLAGGQGSFAAGRAAKATNDGAFVWSDDISPDLYSTNNNSVTMRARGGFRFFTSQSTAGVFLAAGSGSWTSMSDRNAKENFEAVDGKEVLEKVASMLVSTWNYKSQEGSVRHMGPMAQDFKAAFGVGETETGITTVDADGVALAAIKGLHQVVKEKEAEIQSMKEQIAELKHIVESLAAQKNAAP